MFKKVAIKPHLYFFESFSPCNKINQELQSYVVKGWMKYELGNAAISLGPWVATCDQYAWPINMDAVQS